MTSEMYCRLCLKHDMWNRPVPIFVDNFPLPSVVFSLLGIELKRNDTLSQVICHLCLAKISFLKEFNDEIKSSTNLLNRLTGTINVGNQAPHYGSESSDVVKPVVDELPNITTKTDIVQTESTQIESPSILTVNTSPTSEITQDNPNNVSPSNKKINKPKIELKKCGKCKYQTTSEIRYAAHLDASVSCPVCKVTFCTLKGMKIHQRNHKVKNLDSVGTVDKVNSKRLSDDCDSNNYSDNKSKKSQWCKLCCKMFLCDEDFTQHNKKFHSEVKKDYKRIERVEIPKIMLKPIVSDSPDKTPQTLAIKTISSIDNNIISTSKTKETSHRTVEKFVGFEVDESNTHVKYLEVLHSVELERKRKADSPTSESKKSKKMQVALTEIFSCWKCKGEYESREKLFIHPCLPKPENVVKKEIINVSDEKLIEDVCEENIAKRLHLDIDPLEESDNESGNKLKPEINMSDCEFIKINMKNSDDDRQENCRSVSPEYQTGCGLEEINIENSEDDRQENCRSVSPEYQTSGSNILENYSNPAQKNLSNTQTLVISTDEINKDNAMLETARSNYNNSSLTEISSTHKICNECGETFNSMKLLFHHKRIHKS